MTARKLVAEAKRLYDALEDASMHSDQAIAMNKAYVHWQARNTEANYRVFKNRVGVCRRLVKKLEASK